MATPARPPAPRTARPAQALVTAQTENRLLLVNLSSGRIVRALTVPGDPTYVASDGTVALVVSSASGSFTLLDPRSLRVIKILHGFASPHIPSIAPDGEYAYVTDDATGNLDVVGLHNDRLISHVFVGPSAHHLAFSPDERQVWVALSQSARTITILSTMRHAPAPGASPVVDLGHPHVVGHLTPGFLAHDLLFTPNGRQVWITSANTPYVGVFSARTRRLLFRIPAGPGPQHLVFADGYAYITSGYGSQIEQVSLTDDRVVRRTHAPYGSFDLDAGGGRVVTASLLTGSVAIYDRRLHLLHVRQPAPSTEDVALSTP